MARDSEQRAAPTRSQQRSGTTNVCRSVVPYPSVFSSDGGGPAAVFVQVGSLST